MVKQMTTAPGGTRFDEDNTMPRKTKPQPNHEQLEAVKAFAARHGRDWRDALALAWMTGSDANQPNGHLLRQVRNTCGPSWLAAATI